MYIFSYNEDKNNDDKARVDEIYDDNEKYAYLTGVFACLR